MLIAPLNVLDGIAPIEQIVPTKSRATDPPLRASDQVATDFLLLVQLGLGDAHDPLMLQIIQAIDAELKTGTPNSPVWRRYNGDGCGDHEDGSAFSGIGRSWTLLVGERRHYALVAGRNPFPRLLTMTKLTGHGGLLPKQVWDRAPIPARSLAPGRPSGSAMPLVWAHSEFVKRVASRALGRPFDRPDCVWQRYQSQRPTPKDAI